MKPKISAEAVTFAREHPLANDEGFLIALTEALAKQHVTATNAERTSVLNRVTAEHLQRLDDEALAAARAEAAKAERERVKAILTAPEAQSNEAFAKALAFGGDMPADDAIAALRSAPKPEPVKLTGPRSADAPGGLVLFGADGELVPAAGPVVSVSPSKPLSAGASKTKAMWSTVIAGLNAEGGGKAATK